MLTHDRKLLIICGASGSGKNYLQNALIKYNGDIVFERLPQITTRKWRGTIEDHYAYDFCDNYYYLNEIIRKKYFSRICINNDFYATKITEEFLDNDIYNKIYTVIANYDGITDIYRVLDRLQLQNYYYTTCKIIRINSIGNVRDGRDQIFINDENNKLDKIEINKTYLNNFKTKEFINVNQVVDDIKKLFKN